MQDETNYDHIAVSFHLLNISKQMDLNDEEYEFIKQFCLPESQGKVTAAIKLKKVCGFTQRQLTQNFKDGIFTLESVKQIA